MKDSGKPIPIKQATDIGNSYGYDQVIIHAYDGKTGMQHITTWGRSQEDCDNAAQGGDFLKKSLGWPDDFKVFPSRVKKLQKENAKLQKDSDKYWALEEYGVDNWSGYEDAMESLDVEYPR